MKKSLPIILLSVLISFNSFSQVEFEMTEGDTTYTMKKYYLVLLKANPNKELLDSAGVMEIQQAHLDNISRLAGLGKIVIAGPMGDDGNLRGIFVMDCSSLEEAESLVQTDPAIQKKRLLAEVHPWWAAKGSRLP
jgi:uncharacterized protein YciI